MTELAKRFDELGELAINSFEVLAEGIPVFGIILKISKRGMLETQKRNLRELIERILDGKGLIIWEEIEDDYLINFSRTMEAVLKLSTNEKVKFFANLIKNGYSYGKKIDNNDFDEIMQMLDKLSYRQIMILVRLREFERRENFSKNMKLQVEIWKIFYVKIAKDFSIDESELVGIMTSISSTGLCREIPSTIIGDSDSSKDMHGSIFTHGGGVFYTTPLFEKMERYIMDKTEDGV